MVIRACQERGREFFVLAFEGETDAETTHGVPHSWIRLGAVGLGLSILKDQGVEELVMAGRIRRPRYHLIRPDATAIRLIARITAASFDGDNTLLSTILQFLEEQGFTVVGVETLVDDILSPEGLIGSLEPSEADWKDIEQGFRIAKQIGALDIGQGVVVEKGLVLGVEAIEGTDALIDRVSKLKEHHGGGVLVKVKKPQQESRVDLPTIGVRTVERIAKAKLRGIAVETGATLMLYRKEVGKRADELGVFVVGIEKKDII